MAKENLLTFITGIRYSKDMLKEINGMTFLFNPNWQIGDSDVSTLPIGFFGVVSCDEVMSTEVSQKQMLFYNTSSDASNINVSSGLLNVVADNIVIKPKQYRMKIIVPANNVYFPIGSVLINGDQSLSIAKVMARQENNISDTAGLSVVQMQTPVLEIIKSLIKDLLLNYDFSNNSIEGYFNNTIETPMFNKNSLEAMWRSRCVLKMKTWDSWKYKYVVITDLTLSKEPTEDGTFEGSLTVQEMPIMTVSKKHDWTRKELFSNKRLEIVGNTIKSIFNSQEVTK